MNELMLSVCDVKKTYPNGIQALKGINFEVKQGEFLVILGSSGSGKSTLLRCINQLEKLTYGKVIFNHKIESNNVAMVFQQFNLISRDSVLNNVLMGSLSNISTIKSIFGFFSDKQKDEALRYLNSVGLSDKAYNRVDQLSGGQQQRVCIARALMQNPKLILADEPVSALDQTSRSMVMDYLKKINKEYGVTIICNLHAIEIVKKYADRVIVLKDGSIIYDGGSEIIDEKWISYAYE